MATQPLHEYKMAKRDGTEKVNLPPAKTLFIRPSALPPMTPSAGKKYVDVGFELCEAMRMVKNVQPFNINGATKIRGLWRLDLKGENSLIARASILATGLSLRGHMVPVLSENPNLVDGQETSRLIITNLPFSVSNDALKSALIETGFQLGSSHVQWEMYRDDANDLSTYKNGKRYIYIAPPKLAVPRSIKVAGKFDAFLNYKGPLPKTDMLIDRQEEVKNSVGYTVDSDSDTDVDDNDLVLKGILKPNEISQVIIGKQQALGGSSSKAKKAKSGGNQLAAPGFGRNLTGSSTLVSSTLDQRAAYEKASGSDQGMTVDSTHTLVKSPINLRENDQQAPEHISDVLVDQHSNNTSAYEKDTDADSESGEAVSKKKQLETLPKGLNLKQYTKETRGRAAKRLASKIARPRSASSNKRKNANSQSEQPKKNRKTEVNTPDVSAAVVAGNGVSAPLENIAPVQPSVNPQNTDPSYDWYEDTPL